MNSKKSFTYRLINLGVLIHSQFVCCWHFIVFFSENSKKATHVYLDKHEGGKMFCVFGINDQKLP